MTDLSKTWPFGLGGRRWWVAVLGTLVLFAGIIFLDQTFVLLAANVSPIIRRFFAIITRLGLSDWILWPSAILCLVMAALAPLVRWKLMRLMLRQFAVLYAFIFLAVGVPSLVTTIVKRLIGRGRPMHLNDTGLWGLHPNALDWTYQSFPSGHATTIFALALTIGFLSRRWWLPALVVAVLVCVSRVVLGVHYPTDVFAGAVLGTLGAYWVRWVFARRGWMFRQDGHGHIAPRPMASLGRYIALKRRGSATRPN